MSSTPTTPDIATIPGPILIVGLGNPGTQYELTRHNVGYMVLDELCNRTTPTSTTLTINKRSHALVGRGMLANKPVILMKSRSYMNESGLAVAATAKYFTVPPSAIIAIHDDLDLDEQVIRVKLGGGEGGHNGLKSMTSRLGTKDYYRVRIGIGRPPGRMDAAAYVLRQLSAKDCEELGVTVNEAADVVELLLQQGLAATQTTVHAHR